VVQVPDVISWRYHVVSIVAVVLAFGLGILAGTSVVNDEFVERLRQNTEDAQEQRDRALADLQIYERFALQLQPTLRDGVLEGREAVVISMEGVDRPAPRVIDELAAAGVDPLATIELTGAVVQPDADDLAALQEIVGTTSNDGTFLRARLAEELADRLAFGSGPGPDDVLADLLDRGLVTADRDLDHEALQEIGGPGQLIVLAAGGEPPDGLPGPESLLLPLVEDLVQLQVDVAVVGPLDDGYGLVEAVRSSGGVPDCSLVTVDDIDLAIGGIALVMGLDRLLEDADPAFLPGGDYGVEAEAIVPGVPPASCRR
jgi:Copper transport outer membrane protein, MctB